MKVIFMSTPDFGIPALEKLHQHHQVQLVVTQKDKPRGRGKKLHPTPIKAKAQELGIPVFVPDNINHPDALCYLDSIDADVIVVIAYGQILKKPVLELKDLIVNIHASVLPRHRGAAPIQRAIMSGDDVTGVSIMKVEEGLDTGDVALIKRTQIDDKTFEELHDELAVMGAYAITEFLQNYEDGEVRWTKQDDDEATYAHKIFKKDGELDFTKSVESISRKIQAFDPIPGAFVKTKEGPFKLFKGKVLSHEVKGEPGEIISYEDGLNIQCGDGIVNVKEIQRPGKRRMSVDDYILGHHIEKGMKIGES